MASRKNFFRIRKPLSFLVILGVVAASAYAVFQKILSIRDVAIILLSLLAAGMIFKTGKLIVKVLIFLIILGLLYWFIIRRYLPLPFLVL